MQTPKAQPHQCIEEPKNAKWLLELATVPLPYKTMYIPTPPMLKHNAYITLEYGCQFAPSTHHTYEIHYCCNSYL
jgi:hypothetical protein